MEEKFEELDSRGFYITQKEQGNEIIFNKNIDQQEKQKHLTNLLHEANIRLPKGTIYEIREKSYSRKYKSGHGAAWYYKPTLKKEPLFLNTLGEGMENKDGGYVLTGRLKAGEPVPSELF